MCPCAQIRSHAPSLICGRGSVRAAGSASAHHAVDAFGCGDPAAGRDQRGFASLPRGGRSGSEASRQDAHGGRFMLRLAITCPCSAVRTESRFCTATCTANGSKRAVTSQDEPGRRSRTTFENIRNCEFPRAPTAILKTAGGAGSRVGSKYTPSGSRAFRAERSRPSSCLRGSQFECSRVSSG
jgi:hypothetical protein